MTSAGQWLTAAVRSGRLTTSIDTALAGLAIPSALIGGYLALLSRPGRPSFAPGVEPDPPETRFVIVVPAHNEAADIQTTVRSLANVDYPADLFRIVVVADNCTDNTASLARNAGAEVVERTNANLRGKGYALEFGFRRVLDDGVTDAVVVVDADTVVSTNLLRACDLRLRSGERALQVDYQVREAQRSWRTRLLRIAFTAFHDVRSTGRERLGVSCGLRGNGMAFAASTLRQVPHSAFSIVEDLEYGIALGQAGIRVAYVHDAWVQGHMPADGRASAAQRDRWERGRALIRKRYAKHLLFRAVRRRDPIALDLAADVLVPPLGQVAVANGFLAATAAGGWFVVRRVGGSWWRSPVVTGIGLVGLIFHVEEGRRRSGTGARGLLDIGTAPVYIGWKLLRRARTRGQTPTEWVRTTRDTDSSSDSDHVSQGAS
jgi:1,2-diacylglycerol 3-beta-glucosyltransferase